MTNYICPACAKEQDLPEGGSTCTSCGASLLGPALATHTYAGGAPPPPPADLLQPGEALGGYVVEKLIGTGGMGTVYLSTQQSLGRKVAIKVLAERFAKDASFVERFNREATALASLSHAHIVSVIDKGISNGRYYLVMEYVDGVSLRDLLAGRKMTPEEALKIVPSICDALEYAHEKGIVHRDIKPENLLLTRAGQVKIADFGLARLTAGEALGAPSITQTHTVMGTKDYMAPEARISAKQADHRADIYSLGVVFYEMLTGELPIGRFELPSQKVHVDVRIDEVVLKTLEANPERRYQRAAHVASDVSRITQAGAAIPPPTAPPPAHAPEPVKPRLTRPREGKWIAGVCAGIAKRYGWEVVWVRLAFVLASLAGFLVAGLVAYLVLCLTIPKEGAHAPETDRLPPSPAATLTRPAEGRVIAGVCAGIARRTDIDTVWVRALFLIGIFVGGLGLIAYLAFWLCMPREGGKRTVGPVLAILLIGLLCIGGCLTIPALWYSCGPVPSPIDGVMTDHAMQPSPFLFLGGAAFAGVLVLLALVGLVVAFARGRKLLGVLLALLALIIVIVILPVGLVLQRRQAMQQRRQAMQVEESFIRLSRSQSTREPITPQREREMDPAMLIAVSPAGEELGLEAGGEVLTYNGNDVQKRNARLVELLKRYKGKGAMQVRFRSGSPMTYTRTVALTGEEGTDIAEIHGYGWIKAKAEVPTDVGSGTVIVKPMRAKKNDSVEIQYAVDADDDDDFCFNYWSFHCEVTDPAGIVHSARQRIGGDKRDVCKVTFLYPRDFVGDLSPCSTAGAGSYRIRCSLRQSADLMGDSKKVWVGAKANGDFEVE